MIQDYSNLSDEELQAAIAESDAKLEAQSRPFKDLPSNVLRAQIKASDERLASLRSDFTSRVERSGGLEGLRQREGVGGGYTPAARAAYRMQGRGFGAAFTEDPLTGRKLGAAEAVGRMVPWAGAALEGAELARLLSAFDAVTNDKASKDQLRLVQQFEDTLYRETGIGYGAGSVAQTSVGFAGDLIAGGAVLKGAGKAALRIGGKALQERVEKWAARQATRTGFQKALGEAGGLIARGAAAEAVGASGEAVGAGTSEVRLQAAKEHLQLKYQIQPGELDTLNVLVNEKAPEIDALLLRAGLDRGVELVTESLGGMMVGPLGKAWKALDPKDHTKLARALILGRMAEKGVGPGRLDTALSLAGMQGIGTEYLEEIAGGAARDVIAAASEGKLAEGGNLAAMADVEAFASTILGMALVPGAANVGAQALAKGRGAVEDFARGPESAPVAPQPLVGPEARPTAKAQEKPAQAPQQGPLRPPDLETLARQPEVGGPVRVVPQEEWGDPGSREYQVAQVARQLGLEPTIVEAPEGSEFAGAVPRPGSVVLNRARLEEGVEVVWHEAVHNHAMQDPQAAAALAQEITALDPQGVADARARYAEARGEARWLQLPQEIQLEEGIAQRVQDLSAYLEMLSTPMGKQAVQRLSQTREGRSILQRVVDWFRDLLKLAPTINAGPTLKQAQAEVDRWFDGDFSPASAEVAQRIHEVLTGFGAQARLAPAVEAGTYGAPMQRPAKPKPAPEKAPAKKKLGAKKAKPKPREEPPPFQVAGSGGAKRDRFNINDGPFEILLDGDVVYRSKGKPDVELDPVAKDAILYKRGDVAASIAELEYFKDSSTTGTPYASWSAEEEQMLAWLKKHGKRVSRRSVPPPKPQRQSKRSDKPEKFVPKHGAVEFRKWFQGSYATTTGKPGDPARVVYHGTDERWTAFDKTKATEHGRAWRSGIFLTGSREFAKEFGDARAGGTRRKGKVMELVASIKTPLILDVDFSDKITAQEFLDLFGIPAPPLSHEVYGEYAEAQRRHDQEPIWFWPEALSDERGRSYGMAKALKGYDGIIAREDGHPLYIVFKPTQIKSVNNKGEWSNTNPDIRFQVASTGKPKRDRFAVLKEMDAESWVAMRRREFVDEFDPVRRLETWLREQGGNTDPEVWQRTGLAPGAALHRFDKEIYRPYIEPWQKLSKARAKRLKKSASEVVQESDDLIDAEHTPDRAAVIRTRRDIPLIEWDDDDASQTGTGLSINEAKEIVKNADEDVREMARLIQAMNRKVRSMLLEHGHISQEEHDAWVENFGDKYVPQRDPEGDRKRSRFQKGGGFSRGGPEAMRAEGRTSRSGSSTVWSFVQAATAVERTVNGDVGRAFLDLLRKNAGYLNFTEVVAKSELRDPDAATDEPGLGQMTKEELKALGETEVFWVKEDGKDIRVDIKDEQLATAMKRLGRQELGPWVRAMGKWNAFQRSLITTYNPAFIPPNFVRDWLTAWVNTGALEDAGVKGITKAIANPKKLRAAYQAMMRYQKGTAGEGAERAEWDQFATEAAEDGMLTGYGQYKTFQSEFERIQKEIKDPNKARAMLRALQDSRLAQFVEDVGFSVENTIRLVAYREMRQAGMSRVRAAGEAKDLTTNFNRKGEYGATLNAAYLFANAGMQGNYKIARVLLSSRTAQKRALGIVAASVAMSIINNMVADDDENGQSAYASLPEWVRSTNFIIMEPGGTRHIKIPLPYGYNVLANLGRLVPDTWFGAVEPGEAFASMGETLTTSFSPLGGGPPEQIVAPTILDPAVQIWTNKAWHGGKLWPDYPGDMRPDSEQAFRSTDERWKAVARWVNEATGGDIANPGLADFHPGAYDLLFKTLTGSTGRFLERVYGMAVSPRTVEPSEVPILRRFYGDAEPRQAETLFYENREVVERAAYRLKKAEEMGDRERARIIRTDYRHLLKLEDDLKQADKLARKFRADADAAKDDEARERAERRRIEALQAFNRKFYQSEPVR